MKFNTFFKMSCLNGSVHRIGQGTNYVIKHSNEITYMKTHLRGMHPRGNSA